MTTKQAASPASLQSIVMPRQPGKGWRQTKVKSVWEHETGLRIHVMGNCLFEGHHISGTCWPESKRLRQCIREQDGNQKRGTMVWALRKYAVFQFLRKRANEMPGKIKEMERAMRVTGETLRMEFTI